MKFTIVAALAAVASAEVATEGLWRPFAPRPVVGLPQVAPQAAPGAPVAYYNPVAAAAQNAGAATGQIAANIAYGAGSLLSAPANFFSGAFNGLAGAGRGFAAGLGLRPVYAPAPVPYKPAQ